MTPDPVGAFCAYDLPPPPHARNGALAGLTFGVKDLYDIAGWPTGAGSPEWLATHPVPTATAPAVARLLAAGGLCVGKTHTDELAWSLFGQNHHYGTPQNVAAPGRIPGGSSSGSAAATAAGLVDFALGSDTGGSVRLPASFCGLYGIRTTHGRIPLEGAVALAPSFDTAGWFARDAGIFARVGAAILGEARPAAPVRRALWAEDLFEFAGEDVSAALRPLQALFGKVEAVSLAEGALLAWRDAFRVVQSSEVWATHGEWVTRFQPTLGPGIRERFAAASRLDPAEIAQAKAVREAVRRRLAALLPPGVVLLAPSAPGAAPRLDAGAAEMEDFRARALALLCPAGHAGLPQVSLPLASLEGCPLGLSVLAAPGEDETLLELARRVRAE